MSKKKFLQISCYLIMILIIVGCRGERESKAQQQFQVVTATSKAVPSQFFYSGIVSPLQIFNVASPTDGVIKEIFFKYGQKAKTNDPLLVISSSKLQEDYRSAMTNFIKAKEDYTNAQINFHGTQELKEAQIISEQEFLSEKDQYDEAALSYLNAKIALEQILQKIPGLTTVAVEKLSPSDITSLAKVLQAQYSDLTIKAKNDGVVLAPQKIAGSGDGGIGDGGDGSGKLLQIGGQVKEGQTLVTIGDLTGISTTVQVSEMAVNQIKTGAAVVVTLDALPQITLQGQVKSVGAQAQASQDGQGGLATFPVAVIVPKLTPKEMDLIRVGMTTKIQITIQNPPAIMIPIAAIKTRGQAAYVTIIGPDGKHQDVPVQTGSTTLDSVAITQGLKPGDQVVVPIVQQGLPPGQ